jgi:hypothetical protein
VTHGQAASRERLTPNLVVLACCVATFRSLCSSSAKLVGQGHWIMAASLGREDGNGRNCAASVANSVRIHYYVPHHLSVVHDRLGGLAHCPRGVVSRDRPSGLSRDLRILAEDIRRSVRIGRGVRDRDGVPVRHQLERAVENVRSDPGTASDVRDLHRLHARGRLFRCSHLWPQPRAAVVLFAFNRYGRVGDDVFGVLDPGQ